MLETDALVTQAANEAAKKYLAAEQARKAAETAASQQKQINLLQPSEKARTSVEGRDVGVVAENAVIAHANQIKHELGTALGRPLDPNKQEIVHFSEWAQHATSENFTPQRLTEPMYLQVNPADGSYALIQPEDIAKTPTDKKVKVVGVTDRKNGKFTCTVDYGTNYSSTVPNTRSVEVSIDTIVDQQYLYTLQAAKKSGLFNPEEIQVMETYAQVLLTGNDQAAKDFHKNHPDILKKVAENSGLITEDTIKNFAEKRKADYPTDPAKVEAPDEESKKKQIELNQKQLDIIDALLKDKNIFPDGQLIASPETVSHVFNLFATADLNVSIDITRSEIDRMIKQRGSVAGFRGLGMQNKVDSLKNADAELMRLNKTKDILEKAKTLVGTSNFGLNFFHRVQNGEIPATEVAKLRSAINANNTKNAMEIIAQRKLNPDEEKNLKNFLRENGKGMGLGGFFIGLLLAKSALERDKK
ncbi:MAG: hypothetical protein Q7R95_11065 [bacterium]|nr:hypothetical protein [bacterium]